MEQPKARKEAYQLEKHGDIRTDYYYWMNQRDDKEVIDHLNCENEYTRSFFSNHGNMEDNLYNEIKNRFPGSDKSAPFRMRNKYFYAKYEEGLEFPIWFRADDEKGLKEEVLLDVNKLAEGHSYYQMARFRISPDGNLLAFAEDTLSRRQYDIRIKDLRSGELSDVIIRNTSASFAWSADSNSILYAERDDTLRPSKIRIWEKGSTEDDRLIYEESDPTFYLDIYPSKSEELIFFGSFATLTSEVRYIRANKVNEEPILIQERVRGLEYYAEHNGESILLRTNLEAKNFRLMKCSEHETMTDKWSELYAHSTDELFEAFDLVEEYLFVQIRKDGLPFIKVLRQDGSFHFDIPADEQTYTLSIGRNEEFRNKAIQFVYSSLTTPATTYETDLESGVRRIVKQEKIEGDFDASEYITRRIEVEADDGTMIPVSLVSKKSVADKPGGPCLLYGYGSYGIIVEPFFRSHILSLTERGFTYAIAHIRGGEDLGRHWYEDGKLLKKMNTFTDFINIADHLIEQKYASEGSMYAMGGSAGGLLMAAVMNLRPDLFKGVVAAVPFVDVITTMLDESIPLTTGEYDEWGNPNEPEFYKYMKAYSPYDNIKKADYPALLVTSGLHDSQVQYWEPTKWVAKLREMKTNDEALLLHTNMEFGHSGAAGRFERYRDIALEYAFILILEKYGMED